MSQFGAEKFTTRSREVIEAAQLSATTGGHTTTEPIHLLVALLKQADGTARTLVTKAGVDADALHRAGRVGAPGAAQRQRLDRAAAGGVRRRSPGCWRAPSTWRPA